jgi:hypothetical protein
MTDPSVAAVFDAHSGAEIALRALQKSALDRKRLSIAGFDLRTEEHLLGFYTWGYRMRFWGTRAAFWGPCAGCSSGAPSISRRGSVRWW